MKRTTMKRNIGIKKKKPTIKVIPVEKQTYKQLKETLSALKMPLPGESSPFGSKAEIEKVENLIARKIAQRKAKRADKEYEAAGERIKAAKAGFDRPRWAK